MIYETIYGESIAKILSAYPPGPHLIKALETLIKTAQQQVYKQVREEVANTVCEGLHDGVGTGLKCLSCYQAEQTFREAAAVEMEIEAAKAEK